MNNTDASLNDSVSSHADSKQSVKNVQLSDSKSDLLNVKPTNQLPDGGLQTSYIHLPVNEESELLVGKWRITVYYDEEKKIKESWLQNITKNENGELQISGSEWDVTKDLNINTEGKISFIKINKNEHGLVEIKYHGTLNNDKKTVDGTHDYNGKTLQWKWEKVIESDG